MTGRCDPAEALAYVDDCLEPAVRAAFERRLKGDPGLRREIALWESQNRAIRAAFGAPPRNPPLELGRASNENIARHGGAAAAASEGAARAPREFGSRDAATRIAVDRPRGGPGRATRRLAGLATLIGGLACAGLPGEAPQAPASLIAAGATAARTLADQPVEFAIADSAALAARLGPRLGLAPPPPAGLRLVGARLAAGSQATATLYVYENARGERASLLVEPLDEAGATAPLRADVDGFSVAAWTGAGYGFVAAAAEDTDVAALLGSAGAGAP